MSSLGAEWAADDWILACCPKEWYPILDVLHSKIEAIAPGYMIDQVKEKWGGLRFYIDEYSVLPDEEGMPNWEIVELIEQHIRSAERAVAQLEASL